MASLDINLTGQNTKKLIKSVKLCTFCSNSTNGFDKWLHATEQDKSPFFPVLAEICREDTVFDELGRILVCIACFHHLLRQWSSYDRRCVPLKKRQYNLIAEENLSNFQIKREEEIRREGDHKLKEIKQREEKIKKEAKERLELYRQKEQNIKEDADQRLIEEEEEIEAIKREAAGQLKEEQAHEEELKRLLEDQIRLERQKGYYIRKEAERLLREEKFLNSTQTPANVRTEVLIHSPQGRAYDQITPDYYYKENTDKDTNDEETMDPSRSRSMEYDPETGCYVRKVPLDFNDKKVEDIVKEEMSKSQYKTKLRSDDPEWKKPEDKERGSTPDTTLDDLSLRASDKNGENVPYYVSGKGRESEYKFTVKEEVKTESSPARFEKNGEFADEDIKKAGDVMKAKFDGDRMKFERDSGEAVMSEASKRSFERRRRNDDDPDAKKAREDTKERSFSLDKRLKDMEERRARLFKGSDDDKADNSEVTITRSVTTETSYSSPSSGDAMLGGRMQDAHRRHRNREERIKRRKNAEEIMSKRSSESQEKPMSPPMKSTGVKLELRGSAFGKKEDSSSKGGSGSLMDEANAWSGSSHSYRDEDDASDILFTVKKPADKKEDNSENVDKKETTFDWNEKERKSSSKISETRNTSVSLMDDPIVWSQGGSGHPGLGDADDISFTVKESTTKKDDDGVKEEKKEKRESRRNLIKETEVKVAESKPVESLFSSDFGQDESQDIVFSVKETSTSTKRSTFDSDKKDTEPTKSKPKELTLERGSYDEKYSFKSSSNSDLMRWEMDNVDSGKKTSEPAETGDAIDGYMGSLRRTNAVGRVGSFNKGRDDVPPAIFHDIESDTPVSSQLDMRVVTPSPVPRDSSMDTGQAPVLLTQIQDEAADDERRRKRQEIEEKKRRIAESQKKANVQRRRDMSESEKKKEEAAAELGTTDVIEDLSEKRRSLLMMWESYADGEGPGPENHDLQEKSEREPFGYDVMMMEAAHGDSNAGVVDYRTMDVEEEKEETRTPMVDIDEYHKLNDDELKWERAGQFQPGKLNTKFHEIGKDESSYEPKKSWQGMNNNTNDVTSNVLREEQRLSYKTPVEEDQSYADETNEVESAPKLLWDESQRQSTHKSDDEEEVDTRKPHVDVDEVYRMTEQEEHWEKVGHFQPGKINTSIFESRKKAKQNETAGSPKIQRREKSRYEQIKKIQRTDSKKELLVPRKVALQSDEQEADLDEEEEEERPYVGKIGTPSFYGTMSEDERQRQEREARNRREMEEIQREKEEERRRQERENLESKTSLNEFEDDEFDTKVKSKDVRKIDITKFSDFQRSSEPIPDVRLVSKQSSTRYVSESRREDKVESITKTTAHRRDTAENDDYDTKVRHRSVGKLSMDSSPFTQHDIPLKETSQPRKVQERTLSKKEEIVVQESPMEMSSPPGKHGEDEFDMTRARSVRKLDVGRFPFSCDDKHDKPESQDNCQEVDNKALKNNKSDKLPDKSLDKSPLVEDRKRVRERENREWEEELKRERDQIDQIKIAHDKAFKDNIKGGNEIDTNDYETESRNIRKLDLSIFSKFQQGDAARESPVRKTSDKDGKRGYVQQGDTVVPQTVREVESVPGNRYEEDEYELKRKSVGKLNKDWLSQAQEQEAREAELRRKESDMERIRKEQYEIEQLKMEEKRRREFERDEASRDESDLLSDKPQSVKKLDTSTMSPFLKGGHPSQESAGGSRKKSKDEVRQERKLARKESRSKMQTHEVLHAEETEDVQQSPESFDDRPNDVGRLNTGKYLQMMGEDHSDKDKRKKRFEEERMRRELEEMEKQREEEERRKEMENTDDTSSSSSDKPQNVNKLDLAQFSKFQQKDTVVITKKQPIATKQITDEPKKEQHVEIISKQTMDEVESAPLEPESSENDWLEKERSEALMYEEKRQNVGRLDVTRFMQSRSEEEQERQSRIKELERQRITKEREEMERLKAEKKKEKIGNQDSELSSETPPSIQSSDPQRDREREEEWTVEEKRKSGVGRLNVGQFMQSLSKEEEEKNRRKVELERERLRREAEERETLRMEQQMSSENIEISTVQEVHSAPAEDLLYERGSREQREREEEMTVEEKRKSVGRLDVNRFVQSISEEAQEKSRRKTELEKERIRRENEERDLLRLEQERGRSDAPSNVSTSSSEEARKYVIVHQEHSSPRGEQKYDNQDEEKYSSLERERDEEMSVEEKRKSVGRLDVNRFMQSLSKEEEEKRKRTIEIEKDRRRREEEEREFLRLEQERTRGNDVSRSSSSVTSRSSSEHVSRTVVQDVQSSPFDEADEGSQYLSRIDREREEELSVEEKRKSVGRLDVNQFMQSLNKEEEGKRRRRIELEQERIRRENQETEVLRMEQETSRNYQSAEQVNASLAQEVHSSPSDDVVFRDKSKISSLEREREEEMSVEEKRKSVGRLDVNQFMQSINNEDREKQMRKIELERERLRREKEEREMEEKQLRLRESYSYSEKIQSSNVEVVRSGVPIDYEESDSSQDKKEVGRLDLQKFSQQIDKETRERERRARDLEIERLRFEREEMEGRGGSQSVEHESWSSEKRETTNIEEKRTYRGEEVDRRFEGQTESIKSDESCDSDKPVPKRLNQSQFSAFQSGSGKRTIKDDSSVKRRDNSESRQSRPKSIAGSSIGGFANGDARSGERVYRIIH